MRARAETDTLCIALDKCRKQSKSPEPSERKQNANSTKLGQAPEVSVRLYYSQWVWVDQKLPATIPNVGLLKKP